MRASLTYSDLYLFLLTYKIITSILILVLADFRKANNSYYTRAKKWNRATTLAWHNTIDLCIILSRFWIYSTYILNPLKWRQGCSHGSVCGNTRSGAFEPLFTPIRNPDCENVFYMSNASKHVCEKKYILRMAVWMNTKYGYLGRKM